MVAEVGMLIDVTKCTGCRGCQVACKQWNQLPANETKQKGTYQNPPKLAGNTWTLVHFIEPDTREAFDKNPRWLFRKQQCFHCDDPACLSVCPTGAIQKRDNGIVEINQRICAGCKYCVEVCPFSTPQADHETGTARKCKMCLDRVAEGLEPACAKACPTGAVMFGSRKGMLSLARQRAAVLAKDGLNPYIYGEKELGGLGVFTLLPEPTPELYNLPKDPVQPTGKIYWRWLLGAIPGLAILYAAWRYFAKSEAAATSSEGK